MKYLNILKNQWLVARAWMLTTLVFMAITIFLVVSLANMSFVTPVRLVPYDFAANNGHVTVSSDGLGDKEEYLTSIGISDVSNYTSWTNRTVKRQYSRFVNRMSPSLYAKAGKDLLVSAEKKSTSEESQVFFAERTAVRDNKISITGMLRLYQGRDMTSQVRMEYILTYNSLNGLPLIIDFSAKPVKE